MPEGPGPVGISSKRVPLPLRGVRARTACRPDEVRGVDNTCTFRVLGPSTSKWGRDDGTTVSGPTTSGVGGGVSPDAGPRAAAGARRQQGTTACVASPVSASCTMTELTSAATIAGTQSEARNLKAAIVLEAAADASATASALSGVR